MCDKDVTKAYNIRQEIYKNKTKFIIKMEKLNKMTNKGNKYIYIKKTNYKLVGLNDSNRSHKRGRDLPEEATLILLK